MIKIVLTVNPFNAETYINEAIKQGWRRDDSLIVLRDNGTTIFVQAMTRDDAPPAPAMSPEAQEFIAAADEFDVAINSDSPKGYAAKRDRFMLAARAYRATLKGAQ